MSPSGCSLMTVVVRVHAPEDVSRHDVETLPEGRLGRRRGSREVRHRPDRRTRWSRSSSLLLALKRAADMDILTKLIAGVFVALGGGDGRGAADSLMPVILFVIGFFLMIGLSDTHRQVRASIFC